MPPVSHVEVSLCREFRSVYQHAPPPPLLHPQYSSRTISSIAHFTKDLLPHPHETKHETTAPCVEILTAHITDHGQTGGTSPDTRMAKIQMAASPSRLIHFRGAVAIALVWRVGVVKVVYEVHEVHEVHEIRRFLAVGAL
jgi:hypothetical protein